MRWTGWLIAVVAVAGLCWRFPLFRVVSLEQAAQAKDAAVFDPKKFAETFWSARLPYAFSNAVPAEVLLPTIQTNAAEAKQKFSRTVGVSESYTYFLSGKGRVLSVTEDEVLLGMTATATNAEVSLQTGLLFSTAVRDAPGVLNVNDYPSSQDFNAISEALNRIVEERVQPKLREQARVGATIEFVGCAEVNDESADLQPLKVVPIQVATP
ncbi:MAG TPA: DUF2291 family protein [Verrucomicrobiae bacterium]|nr:DUF2291 family protein [Verrucomicrobiae bacterium]